LVAAARVTRGGAEGEVVVDDFADEPITLSDVRRKS